MLIQLIMTPLILMIKFLINLLPTFDVAPNGFNALLNIIGYGCTFVGTNFFLIVLGNITFWLTAQLTWVLIEWAYKKIPGIN